MEEDRKEARIAFCEFDLRLRQLIRFEEEALFPLYEKHAGFKGIGPTDVMRLEHQIIEQLLSQLGGKLRAIASEPDAEQVVLIQLLRGHTDREETGIYSSLGVIVN